MRIISLEFQGYYLERESMPSLPGIYCVYKCIYNRQRDTVSINDLLYIGESINVKERLVKHDRIIDWQSSLENGERLCYSYAYVSNTDRERAEAALIYEHQPRFNEQHIYDFGYLKTEIITKGQNKLLAKNFIID